MGAGLGFKTFVTGDVLTAGDTNGYLMQGVWVFASAAARTSAVTSPQEGNMSFLKDTNSTEYYDGAAWVAVSGIPSFAGTALYKTATQSCPQGVDTLLTWENEYLDTNSYHSTSSNTSRITIPSGKAGKYLVMCQLNLTNEPTVGGINTLSILKNGSMIVVNQYGNARWTNRSMVVSTVVDCAVGDYLQINMFINDGTNRTTEQYATWCYAYLIGA